MLCDDIITFRHKNFEKVVFISFKINESIDTQSHRHTPKHHCPFQLS